jgi:bifunctional enzyme CysN/CysC/sulfate adenylyltransferase subunit 1
MGFDENKFNEIQTDYIEFAKDLELEDIQFVPLSALDGDNVVNRSERSPWYKGKTLMEMLETVKINANRNLVNFRFPVQYVNRPNLDFRGFCGTVASGIVRPGDKITALPSGKESTVKAIVTAEGNIQEAFAGQAVTLTLEDEIDISRGDMIVKSDDQPLTANTINADIVWMAEDAMKPGKQYNMKFASAQNTGSISGVHHRIDVNTMEKFDADDLKLNEIGLCEVTLNKTVAFDPYKKNRASGAFIIIDRLTNVTVGAGMIVGAADDTNSDQLTAVSSKEKADRFDQKAASIVLTGSNKHVLAGAIDRKLFALGKSAALVSKDDIGNNNPEDIALIIKQAGLIAICTFEAKGEVELVIDADTTSIETAIAEIQDKGII